MTYSEAIEFLYELRWFGAKLGLRNVLKLANLAGNPQERLRFIHVAGTNGKGSTCAMLESIYREAGLRVGLFTSPHLVAFGERIQIDRRPISEQQVVKLLTELQPLLRYFPRAEHPTFFEVVTVMALRHFAEEQCDLVMWETGLGGRLDATNIVTPLVSVITNVQYDHQEWLGDTLASIATEKAGIIKPGIPVITAAQGPEALAVIEQIATSQKAPLTVVSASAAYQPPLDGMELPLPGAHQRINAALAVATVHVLNTKMAIRDADPTRGMGREINDGKIPEQTIRAGLLSVSWPGRMQLLKRSSGQQMLLDGAHNVGGAEALKRGLLEQFPKVKPVFILGILRDKDWRRICQMLAPLARRIYVVPVGSQRTETPENLQKACQAANPGIETCACDSVAEALERTAEEPFIVVTGSLYLVGEALAVLEAGDRSTKEQALNEWVAPQR